MTKLEVAAHEYACKIHGMKAPPQIVALAAFQSGAEWKEANLWKDAQGDDLPDVDREVVVLCDDNLGGYKVCFGHRPNPQGYYGKNLTTGEEVRKYRYEVETYDKGGWNIPDVRWWLDLDLPKLKD